MESERMSYIYMTSPFDLLGHCSFQPELHKWCNPLPPPHEQCVPSITINNILYAASYKQSSYDGLCYSICGAERDVTPW